jgi:hypothetical protein
MKKKKFDCVQMKHDIQKEILKERRGLSPEEQRRRSEARIAADPILGPIWRQARRVPTQDIDLAPAKLARSKSR